MVINFNLTIQSTNGEKSDQWVDLCVTDLITDLLYSKVDQTVDKYLQKVSISFNKSDTAFKEIISNEIDETKTQIE